LLHKSALLTDSLGVDVYNICRLVQCSRV